MKVHLHHFSKLKSHKKSQNSRSQGFSFYFRLMIEGSGSVPRTNESKSGKPKNIRNLRIRIHNTGRNRVRNFSNLQVPICIKFLKTDLHTDFTIRSQLTDPESRPKRCGSGRIRKPRNTKPGEPAQEAKRKTTLTMTKKMHLT